MKKPGFLKKFTIIDYLIIIVVIAAIIFAVVEISSPDQSGDESSSYDSSTFNKVVEKYLGYYLTGNIVTTTVEGVNASNNEPVSLDGNIIWMDDNSGNSLKVLVESNGNKYLLGEYQDIPNADIYLNRMTLTVDGSIYPNLTEVMISPMNVTSLSQLTDSLGNKTNYEISTTVTVDSVDGSSFQEAENALYSGDHRISIKSTNTGLNEQLKIIRATSDEINLFSGILGNINGTSDEITIRIYNCTNQDLENIENNFNVLNVKTF